MALFEITALFFQYTREILIFDVETKGISHN